MASKLSIYNGALSDLGSRKIASLSEARESRRVLDAYWDQSFVRQVLSEALWKFSIRTVQLEASASIEPSFGYRCAFEKPSDWVRTAALSLDEYLRIPLLEYRDEAGFWFCDSDLIYVSFVSDDVAYGGDLSLWPANVERYASLRLGYQACKRITDSTTDKQALERDVVHALRKARSTDAMDQAERPLPPGSWSRARHRDSHLDRGSRNRLIG